MLLSMRRATGWLRGGVAFGHTFQDGRSLCEVRSGGGHLTHQVPAGKNPVLWKEAPLFIQRPLLNKKGGPDTVCDRKRKAVGNSFKPPGSR